MCRKKTQDWNVSIETKCQGIDLNVRDPYHAISYPIYQTATFSHVSLEEHTGYDYTRQSNPTRQQLESVVALLENGREALAFSSGMAAVSAVMELFEPGERVIVDEDLYGGSVRLFNKISRKNGIDIVTADLSGGIPDELVTEKTRAVFLETPTNPMMHVADIGALSAFTREKGLLLIVDNTFLSPYFQNPLDHGADIVIHSGTKYLCGHHDTIGGFAVTGDTGLADRLRYISTTVGYALAPFDCWLILRGIRTLAVRMDRAEQNAMRIAEHLKESPFVKKVIYPGLPEHPGYEIMKKQARGFGAMISFEVPSKAFAAAFLRHVKLFYFAESLGGTETLVTYPVTQTHAEVPALQREKNGINDRLLRLSVGIEGAEDLIDEIDRVFRISAAQLQEAGRSW